MLRVPQIGRVSAIGPFYQANRIMVWTCIVLFVNQLGFGAVVPTVPLYARTFGVSQAAIGLTIAVYGLARFLMNLPTSRMADRLGRRWTLILGEAVTATGNLLCGISTSYEQFLFFRMVAGAGGALVATSGQVIMADVATDSNRGRSMSFFHAVFLMGNGFGPLPGGVLASHFGLPTPFFAFTALGVVAGALALDKIPETRGMGKREKVNLARPAVQMPMLKQLRRLFRQIGFSLISAVAFVQTYTRTGALYALVPLQAVSKLGLSPEQIGVGLGLVTVGDLATVYFSGLAADRFGRKTVIVPASVIAAVGIASFSMAPDFGWFSATLAVWGVSMGMAGPTPAAYAADMAPPGMNATTLGFFRTASDLGYVVGPLLLGWVADVSSIETGLLSTAALFLVIILPFAAFAPETGGRKRALAASR